MTLTINAHNAGVATGTQSLKETDEQNKKQERGQTGIDLPRADYPGQQEEINTDMYGAIMIQDISDLLKPCI